MVVKCVSTVKCYILLVASYIVFANFTDNNSRVTTRALVPYLQTVFDTFFVVNMSTVQLCYKLIS